MLQDKKSPVCLWGQTTIRTTMNANCKTQIEIVNGKTIYLEATEWGYFIQVSDGYTSDYFSTKKDAIARRAEIKKEMKKGCW